MDGSALQGDVILQHWEDTVQLEPLDRKESLLPVRRPPDVVDPVWDARTDDWRYPMHCHAEPSQTAAGGLYPGGLVADWVVAADAVPESGLPGTTEDAHHKYRSQVEFASDQPHEGSPETEFLQRPDVKMEFDFFNRKLKFPERPRTRILELRKRQVRARASCTASAADGGPAVPRHHQSPARGSTPSTGTASNPTPETTA